MPRLLISNNHLRRHAGSEMVTLELTEEFVRRGWQVDISTNLFLPPFSEEFAGLIDSGSVRASNDPYEAFGLDYDLIWVHHNLLPASTIEAMADAEFSVPVVWHHMSPIAHIEFPLLADIENSIADRMSFMSEATRDALLEFGLDAERALVLPNPVPHSFVSRQPLQPAPELRSLAVVSNHVPDEVYAAARILREQGIAVEFIGGSTPQRMTPAVLQGFDAVLTIGKTVQYALALGLPAYVYDHFGGDGWLHEENFSEMSRTNFSGRNSHRKIPGAAIAAELLEGYAIGREFATSQLDENRSRYSLPNYIDSLLAETWVREPRPKRLSEAQKLRWLGFAEQFRGLYRELEYFKDRAVSTPPPGPRAVAGTGLAAESPGIQREAGAPLVDGAVAVVAELDELSIRRSLLSIRSQIKPPSELHLLGASNLVREATNELADWAEAAGVSISSVIAEEGGGTLPEALNRIARVTHCGVIAVMDRRTSWLHTFLRAGLDAFAARPDSAAVLHRSIAAFADRATGEAQYFFDYGPPRAANGPLLTDELMEFEAVPLSNLLIRTAQLLEVGGLDDGPSGVGARALLLRLSRTSPVVMAAGHAHAEVVQYRVAGSREIADRAALKAESERESRQLIDSLMKSPNPNDNTFALMLDRKRSQESLAEVARLGDAASDRLDLLLQRVPAVGFETRLRAWVGAFPGRARGALKRRARSLVGRDKSAHPVSQTPAPRRSGPEGPLGLIAQSDVVSFDVFDTLLDRPLLRPFDVFAFAAEAVQREHRCWITPEWPEQRVAAELHCYGKPGVGPDITIEDVYAELGNREIVDPETLDLLLQAELDVELQLLAPTARGSALFREAQRLGKTIIIASDMYLPKETVAEALAAAGYAGWDRLIVSGYDKIGKHSGTAFGRIAQDYPGKRIVHFGDNLTADVIQPRHYGMASELLRRPRDLDEAQAGGTDIARLREDAARTGFSTSEVSRSLIGGMVERRLDQLPNRDPLADVGYSVLGPALVGLSQWLDAQARRNGTQKLLFLAREGRLMMNAYQELWGERGIDSQYAYASRRMINLTQVEDRLTDAALDFLAATGTPLSVTDYIRRFLPELPRDRIVAALEGTALTPETVLGPERSAEVRAVFMRLEDELVGTIRDERVNVLDYLRAVGADRPDAGVVDIGWQGSIQRSIERSLNPNLLGYYFAVHNLPTTRNRRSLNGFVDPRSDPAVAAWHQNSLIPGIEMVELLFANPEEASVSGVRRTSDGFAPVYSSEKLGPEEAAQIRTLQAAALAFVGDFAKLEAELSSGLPRLAPEAALAPLSALITDPTLEQAAVMGRFPHDNSLGIVATPLGMPLHSAEFYRKNPAELRAEYDSAWWKPGFRANARARGIDL